MIELSTTLPSTLAFNLRWFSNGNHIDVCVDICSQFGRFFPSEPLGQIIKQGQLRSLLAKGYLLKETVYSFGIQYSRFKISSYGTSTFERYKNDCSNK